MALVTVEKCVKCGRARGQRHVATKKAPGLRALERMLSGIATATDGCRRVRPAGHCEHGHAAWPLALGII